MWDADQLAAGRTDEEIAGQLAEFDVWDRYDHDGDGNFNEPDGYIDHFQIAHAGGDQADGDPHRVRTRSGPPLEGLPGHRRRPTGNQTAGPRSATPASGSATTRSSRRTAAGRSSTTSTATTSACRTSTTPRRRRDQIGWWSIMAQSRLSARDDVGIGTRGADLGPWEKLQLGWLDYEITVAGQDADHVARAARVQQPEAAGTGHGASTEGGRHRAHRTVRG